MATRGSEPWVLVLDQQQEVLDGRKQLLVLNVKGGAAWLGVLADSTRFAWPPGVSEPWVVPIQKVAIRRQPEIARPCDIAGFSRLLLATRAP